jgi:hypothetical protein
MTAPQPGFPGVFFADASNPADLAKTIDGMSKAMTVWTFQAARGECSWICSDCCITCPSGMPDECVHGQQRCTDIIKRDKADALLPENGGPV